jgi:hypothetical protein
MTDKERIEEMARDVCKNVNTKMCADGTCPKTWECPYSNIMANILMRKGYRKIPEGSVVLSEEEAPKYYVYLHTIQQLEGQLKEARKETAREILDKVDKESNGQTKQITDVIRKQFGVEIKE